MFQLILIIILSFLPLQLPDLYNNYIIFIMKVLPKGYSKQHFYIRNQIQLNPLLSTFLQNISKSLFE